jgi:ferredoxin
LKIKSNKKSGERGLINKTAGLQVFQSLNQKFDNLRDEFQPFNFKEENMEESIKTTDEKDEAFEKVKIDREKCTGCGDCVEICPEEAIVVVDEKATVNDDCSLCEVCIDECPEGAISA